MAYTKLPKVLSDYAVGYQTLNYAQGNFESQRAAFAAYHGDIEAPTRMRDVFISPLDLLGAHDDMRIPRAIVQVSNEVLTATLTRPECWGLGGVVTSFEHPSTGNYFFGVENLAYFYGLPTPLGSSISLYLVSARSAPSPKGIPGIWVSSFNMATGSMVAEDIEFSLAVYGTR